MASPPTGSAWSETPGTRRHSLHGNREVSSPPMPSGARAALGSRTPMMHGGEKSDPAVVAVKSPNKAGTPVAEAMEPRAGAKENAEQRNTGRTQGRENVLQSL